LRDDVDASAPNENDENKIKRHANEEKVIELENEKEELLKKIQELEAIQTSHMDCEQTIKNLELENERLQEELSKCEKRKT